MTSWPWSGACAGSVRLDWSEGDRPLREQVVHDGTRYENAPRDEESRGACMRPGRGYSMSRMPEPSLLVSMSDCAR